MMRVRKRSPGSINAWYDQYAGFDGDAYLIAGYAEDLRNRNLSLDDPTPSDAFATSYDGQVIERLDVTGRIDVLHADVVVRGCRITSLTFAEDGIRGDADDVTIEHCSLVGPGTGEDHDRAIWIERSARWTIRFNWLDGGYSSGFQLNGAGTGGSLWEYNTIPEVRYFPDSHNTSMTFSCASGELSIFRCNNLRDGNSAAMSIYPQEWCGGGVDNLLIEENIFGINDESHTWYYINPGGDFPITNVWIQDNVLIPGISPDENPRQLMGDERGSATWFPNDERNVWARNEWLDGSPATL